MQKKFSTRLISALLAALMIFAGTSTAYAYQPEEETTEQTQTGDTLPEDNNGEGTTEPGDEPADEPEDKPEENENTIVARASLFSAMYVFPVSAHTWIYVENLTDEPMMVGLYEVPPGQGVSVGTFSFSVNDGWGIYYNLEAYRENRNDNIDDCRSITQDMTRSQLEKLSKSIRNYVNMWDIFVVNCTFFAFSIWNANSKNFFIPFIIPAIPILEVIIAGGKKGVTPMYYPTRDQVFRQRGTGDNAYLEPVGDETINK